MEQGCVQLILSDDVMCHMYGNDKGEYDDMKKRNGGEDRDPDRGQMGREWQGY